jgi:dihydrofolate reductase
VPDPRDAPIDDNAAVGKVIFLMNVSHDGYIETPDHSLDWTIPDDELLTWFNERTRSIEALVYGRRLHELMNAYWPTAESDPAATGPMVEFARIWNAKPKVVVSSSMARPTGFDRADAINIRIPIEGADIGLMAEGA